MEGPRRCDTADLAANIQFDEPSPRFDIWDSVEYLQYLHEHGYCVVKGVASPAELERAESLIWEHLEEHLGMKAGDVETWKVASREGDVTMSTGIMTTGEPEQSDFLWYVRTLPSIREIYSRCWNRSSRTTRWVSSAHGITLDSGSRAGTSRKVAGTTSTWTHGQILTTNRRTLIRNPLQESNPQPVKSRLIVATLCKGYSPFMIRTRQPAGSCCSLAPTICFSRTCCPLSREVKTMLTKMTFTKIQNSCAFCRIIP